MTLQPAEFDRLTRRVIGAAMTVHRTLGPGLLESAYQHCLAIELQEERIEFAEQVALPLSYRGHALDCSYRLDFVVEHALVLEIKAVEALAPIHQAQLLSYLRMGGFKVGLLINFHTTLLKSGLRRVVNDFPGLPSSANSANSASRR
jgi:GxxExxY protein